MSTKNLSIEMPPGIKGETIAIAKGEMVRTHTSYGLDTDHLLCANRNITAEELSAFIAANTQEDTFVDNAHTLGLVPLNPNLIFWAGKDEIRFHRS